MRRIRKYKQNKLLTLSRQQIMFIEDEWYGRLNKSLYNINTNEV